MNILDSVPLTLHNFVGPLDFLVHLVLRGEVDIYDVPLQLLTEQFIDKHLDTASCTLEVGAEFVGTAATLVWLKSKRLLPQTADDESNTEEELNDGRFELIHQLVEYCRIKKAAQALIQKEEQQSGQRYRSPPPHPLSRPNGLEYLPLEELSALFQGVLQRAASNMGTVYEEKFKVADAMKFMKEQLKEHGSLSFDFIFHEVLCREEMIVTFLALLELMKIGILAVVRGENNLPLIVPQTENA
ncbi:MAG: segregation/condensation protein A [Parachlamydiales bacterium]